MILADIRFFRKVQHGVNLDTEERALLLEKPPEEWSGVFDTLISRRSPPTHALDLEQTDTVVRLT